MTATAKLGAFAAALAVVFVLALGVGRAAGPIDVGGDGRTAEQPVPAGVGHGHDR